jgi:hypothetical protein
MVSLKIHKKYRLSGETIRLLCRIIYIQNNLYQLLSSVGILDRFHAGYNLNYFKGFDTAIPQHPTETQKITIGRAYMAIYNRPSMADLQPAGQKRLAKKAAAAALKAARGKKGKGKEVEVELQGLLIESEHVLIT